MAHLIDKAALVAEIEKLKKSHDNWSCMEKCFHKEYENLLSFIDTLELKEVEFEKELDKEWNKCVPIDEGMGLEIASIEHEQFDNIAKHFYELGLKVAQKGE